MAESLAERDIRDAGRAHGVDDALDARVAEIEERERALAAREQLIRALESRLDDSRRRLEERLQQVKSAPRASFRDEFRVAAIDGEYFHAGSHLHEDEWWSRQLGKTPSIAA